MSNPHPFEALFKQISDLLLTIQEKPDPVIPQKNQSSIEEQLDHLEQYLTFFRNITNEALVKSGLNEESLQKTIDTPQETSDRRERKVLDKAKKLKDDIKNLELEVAKKTTAAKIQKRKTKTEGKNRKKKFKRLGGQGWMPL